jgi:hypothetical protein
MTELQIAAKEEPDALRALLSELYARFRTDQLVAAQLGVCRLTLQRAVRTVGGVSNRRGPGRPPATGESSSIGSTGATLGWRER